MEWQISRINNEPLNVPLEPGRPLFVLGPNGSGKSALIQNAVTSLGSANVRRISAHRKTWLTSSAIDLTAQSIRQFDQNRLGQELFPMYRYQEWDPETALSSVLFDLTAKDNSLARRIMDHAYADNQAAVKGITESERPVFEQINELLGVAGFAVTVENADGEEILARHDDVAEPYGMEKMSDGERSAVILAATVLTVDPGIVLLIDEPERHLHRSVIEPFLTALFEKRDDCPFVISTHEPALPLSSSSSSVLTIRSCQWNGESATAWDIELLNGDAGLPEDLKRAILGVRRKIIFVEGKSHGLDVQLYEALFPDISIRPVDSCDDVIKLVRGLRNSREHHDVEAFGLIDGDNRNPGEVNRLTEQGIHALDEYSVESLYFCSDALTAVGNWQAEALDEDADELLGNAKTQALVVLRREGVAERMAARRCERIVRAEFQSRLPDWKSIIEKSDHTVSIDSQKIYNDELRRFIKLLDAEYIGTIVARYPVRHSNVIEGIIAAFNLSRANYQKTLLARVRSDSELAEKVRSRIGPLSQILRPRDSKSC